MKRNTLVSIIVFLGLSVLLFSGFQRTQVQQFQVVGAWKLNPSTDKWDFVFYEWDNVNFKTIEVWSVDSELRRLNANGYKIVATYSVPTGASWNGRVVFIVE